MKSNQNDKVIWELIDKDLNKKDKDILGDEIIKEDIIWMPNYDYWQSDLPLDRELSTYNVTKKYCKATTNTTTLSGWYVQLNTYNTNDNLMKTTNWVVISKKWLYSIVSNMDLNWWNGTIQNRIDINWTQRAIDYHQNYYATGTDRHITCVSMIANLNVWDIIKVATSALNSVNPTFLEVQEL